MTELTDLEICERIAEIEGYIFDTGSGYFRCKLNKHGKVVDYIDYNPLTDNALCFQLMVKHDINLTSMDSVYDCGRAERDYTCFNKALTR